VRDAFFLPVEPGQRFCIFSHPGAAPRRAVVYLHPFAEEMNKARRMAALQARRLAAEGFAVLQVDFLGCGDSSGEFVDARWERWKRDVHAAIGWLRERFAVPLTLWGLRLGAALAAEITEDVDTGIDHLLLWQPVTGGSQFLSQFLRLRLASEMLASGTATTAVRELTAELARGNTLEIAGYELHPDLAAALERIRLEALLPAVKRVDWMEVVAERELPLRPAAHRVIEAWRSRGLEVRASQAAGEPFWSTIEIAECEELLALTDDAMKNLR
jgi:exosortase A-associated hydrolase 2